MPAPLGPILVKLGWGLVITGSGLAALKFVVENFVVR